VRVVYSEQRARVLRVSLRVVIGLAVAMVAVAAYVLARTFTDVTGDTLETREAAILYVIVLVVQAGVLVTIARWALKRLPDRSSDARFWCLMTAGLTLLASLPLLTNLLGIVVVFVGIFLLTSALRTDRVQPGTPGPAQ
jgi:NADH:ubiquinone oxidoreductase subunit 2 (subunit N)